MSSKPPERKHDHPHPAASAMSEFLGIFGEDGLTEKDRNNMAKLAARSRYGRGKVSHRLCEEIRRRRHRGYSTKEVVEQIPIEITPYSVSDHASGRCKHITEVPEVNTKGAVTDLMCGLLRQLRWMGASPTLLAEGIGTGITHSSVSHHTTGECTHDTAVPPFTRRTVSLEQCREWNERRAAGDPMPEIAETTPFKYVTVAKHTNDNCNHDHSISTEEATQRPVRCREWRVQVLEGRSPADVAASAECGEEMVRRHVTGACEHGFEVDGQPALRKSADGWVPAGEMWNGEAPSLDAVESDDPANDGGDVHRDQCNEWREEILQTQDLDAVADESDFSTKTVQAHVIGGCEHGFESSVMPVRNNGAEWVSTGFESGAEAQKHSQPSRRGATFE